MYVNPASAMPRAIGDVPVELVLLQAGYRPTRVTDPEELDQALRQGGWDLVLADLDDSAALRGRLQGDGEPMVLPVLYKPTRSDLAQAKKDYGRALKAPFKSQRFLETIDGRTGRPRGLDRDPGDKPPGQLIAQEVKVTACTYRLHPAVSWVC